MTSDMSFDHLDNLLSKVDAIDDILECPVCYERMSENIPLCAQGHPVCRKCLIGIDKCPLCNSKFKGARDYLAESMISKFEEIKSALINLTLNSSGLCTEEKKSEATTVVKDEKFPCGIKYCYEILSYNDMIAHIKNNHQSLLINEGVVNYNTYTNWWIVRHDYKSEWEKIIYIKNMGIFFLKISISSKGNVYGYLLNAHGLHDDKNFYYKLEIEHPYHDDLFFDGLVANTRNSHNRSQYLNIGSASYKDASGYYYFDCNLRINRV